MPSTADQSLHDVLVALVTIAAMGGLVAVLVRSLGSSRPGFAIGFAVAVAFGIRVIAAGLLSLTSVAQTLRGGDEIGFVAHANLIADTPLASTNQWTDALVGELHVFTFALQRYFLESPDLSLRVVQVGIAVTGFILLAAAVYELAGPKASVIAMWVLAFEPASVFFSSLLHKEANMMLAIALVAYGGTNLWKGRGTRYLGLIAVGCLIAVATRPYAGWFLIAGASAIVLHAGFRSKRRSAIRPWGLVAVVVLFGAVAAPIVLEASTDKSLEENLQGSQDANASDNSNLSLERVDFSTRGAVIKNLPRRVRDVLLRPYPWQLGNISQGLGLLGTMAAYGLIVLVISTAIRSRGRIFSRAGPFIYVTLFLLFAYALSAGNAGTSFRYRTQIVSLLICIVVVLWSYTRERHRKDDDNPESAGQTHLKSSPSVDLIGSTTRY